MANTCEKYLKDVSKFIDTLKDTEINSFCDEPDKLVQYLIDKYIGSLGYLSITRGAWAAMATRTKEKYIKTIKILFWKLHKEIRFTEGCREHNVKDIKELFKETLVSSREYISTCAGKQYTYKHSNSIVKRYNSGLRPEVEAVVVPTNRTVRSLTRSASRQIKNEANMKKVRSFLLRKTRKIRRNKEMQEDSIEQNGNFKPLAFNVNKLTKPRPVSPRFAVTSGPVTRSQTARMRSQAPPPSKRRNMMVKKTKP